MKLLLIVQDMPEKYCLHLFRCIYENHRWLGYLLFLKSTSTYIPFGKPLFFSGKYFFYVFVLSRELQSTKYWKDLFVFRWLQSDAILLYKMYIFLLPSSTNINKQTCPILRLPQFLTQFHFNHSNIALLFFL